MNKNDKAIIKANPGKTHYELIQLGLSTEGFEELERDKSLPHYEAKLQPVITTVSPTSKHAAKPMLTNYEPSGGNSMATLVDKKTGRRKSMDKTAAEKMARKYPNEFSVTY